MVVLGKREELPSRAVFEAASEKRARSNVGTGERRRRMATLWLTSEKSFRTGGTEAASEKRPQQRGELVF